MVLEFPHSVETLYKALLIFNVAITIPSHLLMIVLAQFCTPKEMKPYKYNVTNTTFWSILFTIHTMIFFRPMPLFPLPAAKVLGDFCNQGDYYCGHVQFMIMVILISNVYLAQFICFCNLYLSICHHNLHEHLHLKHGIIIYLTSHILMTLFCIYIVQNGYIPSAELKLEILKNYPYLNDYLYQKNLVMFGFNQKNEYTSFLIKFAWILFILTWICVPVGLLRIYLFLKSLEKSNDQTLNFKRMMLKKMIFRTFSPMLTGLLPVALSFLVARNLPDQSFTLGNIVMMLAFSHGFWISFSTYMIFPPFRKVLVEIPSRLKRLFKENSNRTGPSTNYVASTNYF